MIDWKPIETAPNDRRVLLFFPEHPEWARVQGGKWSDDRYAKRPRPRWDADKDYLLGMRWTRENPPTHWADINEPDGV